MYSKQEASKLRQDFWTTFGRYMAPIQSAEGEKVNWINYKTGIKSIYFKMDAGNKSASIAILISHKDVEKRREYYNLLWQMKSLLHDSLQEEWTWVENEIDDYGVQVSKVFKNIYNVNVFNKGDWPQLISFFKQRIIALDNFWNSAKYGFESLG